jgi:hypothetical protein
MCISSGNHAVEYCKADIIETLGIRLRTSLLAKNSFCYYRFILTNPRPVSVYRSQILPVRPTGSAS